MPIVKKVKEDSQSESLGSQMIEGVPRGRTRTTITIPAERWERAAHPDRLRAVYSPELQTVVMTKAQRPAYGRDSGTT